MSRSRYLVGGDIETPTLAANPYLQHRVATMGDRLPFAPGVFDLVSANMVVEHLETPALVFTEIQRVLAPGGTFVFHTPNRLYPYIALASLVPRGVKNRLIWVLERRAEEDVFKTHYRANSVGRIRELAELTGFTVGELSVGGSVGLFRLMGPLAILELPYLKLLTLGPFRDLNATIIGVLTKR